MDEFTEKFEYVKKHYHCKICPDQFGWLQEYDIDSAKKHHKIFHQGKQRKG